MGTLNRAIGSLRQVVSYGLMVAIVIAPALRPAEKYLGHWAWWVPYLALATALIFYVLRDQNSWLARMVASKIFIFGMPVLLGIVSALFYPAADALKDSMQGQDQDDCTVLGVQALLTGGNPVSEPTYFGNPCSNLLGAIIPHLPFVITNLMGLAGPVFFLAIVIVMNKIVESKVQVGLFVAILSGTPATLELMVNGSDFVFIGFAALGSILLFLSFSVAPTGPKFGALVALVSLVSSSRINMPIFAVPYGIGMIHRGKFAAGFICAVGILVVVPNALVYISEPGEFAPLHLIGKGQTLVPGIFYPVMFITSLALIGLGWFLYWRRRIDFVSLVQLCFAPHLVFLSYGDLIFNRQFDLFWWEGANYLYLLTPIFVYSFLTQSVGKPLNTQR